MRAVKKQLTHYASAMKKSRCSWCHLHCLICLQMLWICCKQPVL